MMAYKKVSAERREAWKRNFSLKFTKDMTGKVIGDWKVLKHAGSKKWGCSTYAFWFCECACGRIKEIAGFNLRYGRTNRCSSCAARKRMCAMLNKPYQIIKISDDHRREERKKITGPLSIHDPIYIHDIGSLLI